MKKDMNLKLFTIADNALVDQAGKLSIIGIFTEIYADNFPATHPSLSVVTAWSGETGNHKQKIRIIDPQNKVIFSSDWVNFEIKTGGRHQSIFNISVLTFPQKGDYKVEVCVDGEEKEIGSEIIKVGPPKN